MSLLDVFATFDLVTMPNSSSSFVFSFSYSFWISSNFLLSFSRGFLTSLCSMSLSNDSATTTTSGSAAGADDEAGVDEEEEATPLVDNVSPFGLDGIPPPGPSSTSKPRLVESWRPVVHKSEEQGEKKCQELADKFAIENVFVYYSD